jgi:hypothetical protein
MIQWVTFILWAYVICVVYNITYKRTLTPVADTFYAAVSLGLVATPTIWFTITFWDQIKFW